MLTTIFILLVLGGLGFPMPEEIPLFLGGMSAANNTEPLELLFLVCYLGVLIGDQTMYLFGYFFGQKILQVGTESTFLPAVTPERVDAVREGLRRRRLVCLFIGRHLFLLRSVTFVVAGSLRLPPLEFFAADAVAALFSVSIFMALGYWLGAHMSPELFSKYAHDVSIWLTVAAFGAGILFFVVRTVRKRKHAKV